MANISIVDAALAAFAAHCILSKQSHLFIYALHHGG
jgi:hypothetical protein